MQKDPQPIGSPGNIQQNLLKRTGSAPAERGIAIVLDEAAVSPGEIISGRLLLSWRSPRRVRGVRLKAVGGERTAITVSTGQSSVTYRESDLVLDDTMVLFGNPRAGWQENVKTAIATVAGRSSFQVLEAGAYEYPFQLRIPDDALPSCKGKNCSVRYEILARVDIPAAVDLSAKATVAVLSPAAPIESCDLVEGKGRDGVFVSMEAGSTSPGSRVHGRIRFEGTPPEGSLQLELQAAEWAKAKKHERNSIRGRIRKLIERPLGEQPFEFVIPENFPMPFEGVYSWFRWQVAVKPPRRGIRRPSFVFQIPIRS